MSASAHPTPPTPPTPPASAPPARRRVLVTGGSGFIGSHTLVELLSRETAPIDVEIIDNLSNSGRESLERVKELTGRADVPLHTVDLRDRAALRIVFEGAASRGGFDAVIHFAALKSVGESVKKPLLYYQNNVGGTLNLLELMAEFHVPTIVFSSSATVYGTSPSPLSEDSPVGVGITNPYGQTKFMMEQILRDVQAAHPEMTVVLLRYFNPIGAHPSGRIGEDPQGVPSNLMPYIQQVAVGRRPYLSVFGDDYDTVDGTGVRDYIHVVDLAKGHLAALDWAARRGAAGEAKGTCETFNLGTGNGCSVLQLLRGVEAACGHKIPYRIAPRRPGDLAAVWADASKAERVLGWKAEKSHEDMCHDSWRWQAANPSGFGGRIGWPGAALHARLAGSGSCAALGRRLVDMLRATAPPSTPAARGVGRAATAATALLGANESGAAPSRVALVRLVDAMVGAGCVLTDEVRRNFEAAVDAADPKVAAFSAVGHALRVQSESVVAAAVAVRGKDGPVEKSTIDKLRDSVIRGNFAEAGRLSGVMSSAPAQSPGPFRVIVPLAKAAGSKATTEQMEASGGAMPSGAGWSTPRHSRSDDDGLSRFRGADEPASRSAKVPTAAAATAVADLAVAALARPPVVSCVTPKRAASSMAGLTCQTHCAPRSISPPSPRCGWRGGLGSTPRFGSCGWSTPR